MDAEKDIQGNFFSDVFMLQFERPIDPQRAIGMAEKLLAIHREPGDHYAVAFSKFSSLGNAARRCPELAAYLAQCQDASVQSFLQSPTEMIGYEIIALDLALHTRRFREVQAVADTAGFSRLAKLAGLGNWS